MHLSPFLLLGFAAIAVADDWLFNGYGDLTDCTESKSTASHGNGHGCQLLGTATKRLSGKWSKGFAPIAVYSGADCDELSKLDVKVTAVNTCYAAPDGQYFNSVKV